ncbi:T9SS type A sorting domain-containing protein [Flavivirga spongiicola]|uniref:T9SS type A sorting domain-containing protein n=1 Tax=Flavivirga spongiicola TaxID=421621 RepID=A0ABU7XXQ4_9FLAO|nr:T9SS type A sorting domain-containing protein [Flavivirga sp. MEBiC05379]MDO5979639.1 T9SS type A sorting domain-containing protein [Flavivirga sp. MEBiC05379]
MKKFTLLIIFSISTISINAQTVAWSSDLEDLTGWGVGNGTADTNDDTWGFYSGGGEALGFTGALGFSRSWDPEPAATGGTPITPDNLLFTPTFAIPANALSISFKMKVGSNDPNFFAENFAIIVYDDADFDGTLTGIYEETLTAGGNGSAKDITADIPASFAGKTIGILVRHYDCTNQNQLLVDDFEVSFSTSLSITDHTLEIVHFYPNPVKDFIKIDTKSIIDSAIIVNQLGQRIIDVKPNNIVDNSINLSTLNKGLYFITVKSEERSATIKIVKE